MPSYSLDGAEQKQEQTAIGLHRNRGRTWPWKPSFSTHSLARAASSAFGPSSWALRRRRAPSSTPPARLGSGSESSVVTSTARRRRSLMVAAFGVGNRGTSLGLRGSRQAIRRRGARREEQYARRIGRAWLNRAL